MLLLRNYNKKVILINRIPNDSEFTSPLSSKVQSYSDLSNSYMSMGLMFLQEGLIPPCLVLGYMSVKAMLNANYVHHGGRAILKNEISFDELILFARDQNIIDLDTELFLGEICFLTSYKYVAATHHLQQEQVTIIMNKIEKLLYSLSEEFDEILQN